MFTHITFRGCEIQNPVARAVVATILIAMVPVIVVGGVIGAIVSLVLLPIAFPLHAVGCPGIRINGRGRPIGGKFILTYNYGENV